MEHALIVCSGIGINGKDLSDFQNTVIAEVSQLKRLIINSQRAGVKHFHILSDNPSSPSNKSIEKDKRITSTIEWLKIGQLPQINSKKVLVLESNIIITSGSLLKFFSEIKNEIDKTFILTDDSPDYLVSFDKERGNVTSHFNIGGQAVGVFVTDISEVPEIIKYLKLNQWLDNQIDNGNVRAFNIKDGYWHRLSNNEESVKEAEKLIFSHVGKTATGWIARNINGRMSLPLSKNLIKTPLTPNMVSILINIIGVLCGPFYALGYPLIGALCMQAATVLDRCDGEVARIKLMETKNGQWVDTISDQFTVLSFLIGVPLGYYFQSKSIIPLIFGSYNIAVFIFFLIWSFYFLLKYTNSGSLVAYFDIDKHVDKNELTFMRKILA
ncbi:MAG: CDP-alcohol phosphatidyltransferase family protein, partial [Thermodesulfobacteriota bacterium]